GSSCGMTVDAARLSALRENHRLASEICSGNVSAANSSLREFIRCCTSIHASASAISASVSWLFSSGDSSGSLSDIRPTTTAFGFLVIRLYDVRTNWTTFLRIRKCIAKARSFRAVYCPMWELQVSRFQDVKFITDGQLCLALRQRVELGQIRSRWLKRIWAWRGLNAPSVSQAAAQMSQAQSVDVEENDAG